MQNPNPIFPLSLRPALAKTCVVLASAVCAAGMPSAYAKQPASQAVSLNTAAPSANFSGKVADPATGKKVSQGPTTLHMPAEEVAHASFQEGAASWYGPGFHNRLTANGERYNMDALTAAHRSLPFGTMVLVKNPSNGKSVTVRINDRGPFIKGRIIDLSRAAAKQLGFSGVQRVMLYKAGSGKAQRLGSAKVLR